MIRRVSRLDWEKNIFHSVELKKDRNENFYHVEENGNVLFEGNAIETKRWLKNEMQKIEDEYRRYVTEDKLTAKKHLIKKD